MGALDGIPMGLWDISRGIVGGCLGWFSDGIMGYKSRDDWWVPWMVFRWDYGI